MNYINHLNAFLDLVDNDNRFSAFHITLYMALFRKWNNFFFKNPISISRTEISKMAKIGSYNTYTKCIKELHEWGYINYEPSYSPQKGSLVSLYKFDTATVANPIQVVRPYINKENNKQIECLSTSLTMRESDSCDRLELKQEPYLKKTTNTSHNVKFQIPPLEHVKIYFTEKESSEIEAERFYNYFQSNGWKVGGRSAMKDWKAAARNWILNIPKFNNQKKHCAPNPVSLNKIKNYHEPL